MRKYVSPLLMLVLAALVMVPSWAQAGSGFYISSDIGANFSSGVEFEGASNDSYSDCDAYLNRGPLASGDRCNIPDNFISDWLSNFDGGQGILAGAAVGYSFAAQNPNGPLSGLRVELEYFYRESKHDQFADISCTGGEDSATCVKIRQGEFGDVGIQERLNSITSHNLFANLYYDFANTTRFTPYIGIGGGFGVTEADWSSNWTRTLDQQILRDGFPYPNANFAGTQAEYDEYILPRLNTTNILVDLPAPQALHKPRSATRSGVCRSCSGWITQSRKPCRWVSRGGGPSSIHSPETSNGTHYEVTRPT